MKAQALAPLVMVWTLMACPTTPPITAHGGDTGSAGHDGGVDATRLDAAGQDQEPGDRQADRASTTDATGADGPRPDTATGTDASTAQDVAVAPDATSSDAGATDGAASSLALSWYILVDQFGYRLGDPKVAVLRDPQQGFDANESYGPGSSFEVRRWSDGAVVHSGVATPWNGGAVQASSGDRGWWYDFSSLTTPGSYVVVDVDQGLRSARFDIDAQVYRQVLRAAVRMYFYNRCGADKSAVLAGACWADSPSFLGASQDTEARSVDDKQNASTARDLRGGWFDAGDTNKYVTFAQGPVHRLLTAYSEKPTLWGDDHGIPESGNGVPDLLDEVKWEVDWFKRMQEADGGVLLKLGTLDYNDPTPPSADTRPRYYVPACSSSAIAAAGVFAHAALVYATVPALAGEVADLQQRAADAWTWYQGHTRRSDCDSQEVLAGDADWDLNTQDQVAVVAAVYLFALTATANYGQYVIDHYQVTRPYHDIGWSRYNAEQGEALLFYSALPAADATLAARILADKKADAESADDVYRFLVLKDLYRAFITDPSYHWGSNQVRADNGTSNLDVLTHGILVSDPVSYRDRALGIVHYFHGVNPLGLVYLSNMSSLGAERSASEIYHSWFRDGSRWDSALTSECGPPPGFVSGGPNASNSVPRNPPAGQPLQKSYLDFNTGWPDNSWEITEPGIYYQAAYIKLLAGFVDP
ncbi:MAG: glycoside hydrolase family 9 protein [Pseudomonadota bacterium]